MKKHWLFASILPIFLACGDSQPKEENTDSESTNTSTDVVDLSENPDYQKGVALIGQSDCLTCHKLDEKLIGPSYKEVAAKYDNTPDNIKLLAEKIIKGGKGVWGEVEMTAHPDMSQEDAEALVRYIFLQR
jgi:cytochrome c